MQRLKHSPFHGADSQDHGRLSVRYLPKFSRTKILYTRAGLLGPYCEKSGALWTRPSVLTPVPSQANHSFNHSSSHRRRFQTGQTPEKLARMFRLLISRDTLAQMAHMWGSLVRASRHSLRNRHSCYITWSVLCNNNDGRIKKNK